MTLLVKRSAPLRTIMMSPTGKNMAEIVRISPGAFAWYQGAASVANITAQLLPLFSSAVMCTRLGARMKRN